jgi:hypothetical protein
MVPEYKIKNYDDSAALRCGPITANDQAITAVRLMRVPPFFVVLPSVTCDLTHLRLYYFKSHLTDLTDLTISHKKLLVNNFI